MRIRAVPDPNRDPKRRCNLIICYLNNPDLPQCIAYGVQGLSCPGFVASGVLSVQDLSAYRYLSYQFFCAT
jgi:hypothetical protein